MPMSHVGFMREERYIFREKEVVYRSLKNNLIMSATKIF